jgi:pyruvate/2-oxoglutarate/acetoin dehydrogenase E1 component
MFGDFVTLITDQLVNSITKFRWMYNQQVSVPLLIRTPMGGRRSYGPTHSQTLEKFFLGVPGMRTLAPCALGNPGGLLSQAILNDDDPVLFIENKLLYLVEINDPTVLSEFNLTTFDHPSTYAPTYKLSLRDAPPPAVSLTAYGYMVELAREAILQLAYQHEVFTELIIPTQLSPFNSMIPPLIQSLGRTKQLLVIEEGTFTMGWGAEVLARISEALDGSLYSASRVAAADLPIPASPGLEEEVLPSTQSIVQKALKMVGKRYV